MNILRKKENYILCVQSWEKITSTFFQSDFTHQDRVKVIWSCWVSKIKIKIKHNTQHHVIIC